MRNLKEIKEELDALYTKMDENIENTEEYEKLVAQADALEGERDRAEDLETRKAKMAVNVGGHSPSKSEERELTKMASEVNFAKTIVQTKEKGQAQGLEKEVQQIAEQEQEESGIKNYGKVYKGGNVLATIPGSFIKYGPHDPRLRGDKLNTKATIDVGTEGTDVVQTTIIGVEPALSVDNAVLRAGATVLPNQVGDVQIAKGSTLTMAFEGETDAEADATATFTNFSLSPTRLGGKIPVSWQMMKQASFGIMPFFRQQMEQYIGSTLDAAFFHGATNGPTGIDSTASVGNYSSTHSPGDDPLTWATVVGLEGTVGTANGLKGRLAYCYPSLVANQTKTKFRNTGTSADRIILDEGGQTLNGYPYYISNNIEDDYATTNDHAYIFFGNFQDFIVAFWGGVEILEDPYTSAANATTVLHSNLYTNGGCLQPGSFVFANNISV